MKWKNPALIWRYERESDESLCEAQLDTSHSPPPLLLWSSAAPLAGALVGDVASCWVSNSGHKTHIIKPHTRRLTASVLPDCPPSCTDWALSGVHTDAWCVWTRRQACGASEENVRFLHSFATRVSFCKRNGHVNYIYWAPDFLSVGISDVAGEQPVSMNTYQLIRSGPRMQVSWWGAAGKAQGFFRHYLQADGPED